MKLLALSILAGSSLAAAAIPTLNLLFNANVTIGTPLPVGVLPWGTRTVFPFTGGVFTGSELSGRLTCSFTLQSRLSTHISYSIQH